MDNKINQWDLNYDNFHDYLAFNTQDINNILSMLAPNTPKTLLDIGCGTGQVGREFFHRGYKTVGIDSSIKAIEIAKSATIYSDIIYIHTDIEAFVLQNNNMPSYGLIMCKYVFAFINDHTFFLNAIKKLLDPSGTFVLITPDIKKIPTEKSSIAVPHEKMLSILNNYFTVKHYTRGRDHYYLCRVADT